MAMRAGFGRLFTVLNEPPEIGRQRWFWLGFFVVVAGLLSAPLWLSPYDLLNVSYILTTVFLAFGLCLIWGFGGILSLGQAAFLGVGGYAYGVVGINLIEDQGNTDLALLAGLLVPAALAAVLGYIMFYARLKGVYVAIMMLVVTLLFETFLNQTAGPQWYIGKAHLGGNNGLGRFSADIHEPPSLLLGFGESTLEFGGATREFFYFTVGLGIVAYLGLRLLVNSRLGRILVAIREEPDRTEAFGYDVRLIQTAVFCLGAMLAGLSGILYVSWGNFITPAAFGVTNNILPVIWVAVGGRKSLTATAISTVALVWLSQLLAIQGEYAFIVLGGLLIVVMLAMPDGVITSTVQILADWRRRRGLRADREAA
jgi:ABC-type branched-subunit amino acid transport system permease subunit